MKWEYLLVYESGDTFTAFDGTSTCDGDESLIILLNRLGQDRWEGYAYAEGYYLFKRSLP